MRGSGARLHPALGAAPGMGQGTFISILGAGPSRECCWETLREHKPGSTWDRREEPPLCTGRCTHQLLEKHEAFVDNPAQMCPSEAGKPSLLPKPASGSGIPVQEGRGEPREAQAAESGGCHAGNVHICDSERGRTGCESRQCRQQQQQQSTAALFPRAAPALTELRDGVTGVSQHWKPLQSLCVCSFPGSSPCTLVPLLTPGILCPSESSRCHRQQPDPRANAWRRDKGDSPALCPISAQAGI